MARRKKYTYTFNAFVSLQPVQREVTVEAEDHDSAVERAYNQLYKTLDADGTDYDQVEVNDLLNTTDPDAR